MSDSSPLLLNMGAELANTAGMTPSITSRTTSADGGGGEFAAILQSTLASGSKDKLASPLVSSELELNPLLFSQLNDEQVPLFPLDELKLDELPGGTELPLDEQQLAWQSLLAEYDSSDPETPRLIISSGDDDGVNVQEFSADELKNLLAAEGEETPQAQDAIDLNVLRETIPETPLETPEQAVTDQSPVNPALSAQEPNKSAQPVAMTPAENDNTSNGIKLQRAHADRNMSPAGVDTIGQQADEALGTSQLAGDKTGQTMRQEKLDGVNEASFRSELNAAVDGMLAKANHSSAGNSSNLSGISSYASVSSLGTPASNSSASGPVIASLTVPPQNPAWGEVVGDRVQWMVTQNIQEAKIRLNPPELGMLEVRVQLGNDQQTSISFSSPHSQVRDALESAMPRLREMFGESGLTLGNVDVSHHSMSGQSQADQGEGGSTASSSHQTNTSAKSVETGVMTQRTTSSGTGMLDLYA